MTAKVLVADARDIPLDHASVDLVITSPPYWNVRDYGDPDQIGLEPSVGEYMDNLMLVMAELWRVLSPWGNVFVNLGDTYLGSGGAGGDYNDDGNREGQAKFRQGTPSNRPKSKALVPQRFAIAAYEAGWTVRQEIIWRKPVGELGECRDRVLTQHEQIWHLVKQPKHYPYGEGLPELRTALKPKTFTVNTAPVRDGDTESAGAHLNEWHQSNGGRSHDVRGASPRSVWDINPRPSKWPDHFAQFPVELPARIISGWCPKRVCVTCGEPSVRIVEPTAEYAASLDGDFNIRRSEWGKNWKNATYRHFESSQRVVTGYTDCGHDSWRKGVVLDPFAGTGTTLEAAELYQVDSVGVELVEKYADIAIQRSRSPQMADTTPDVSHEGSLWEGMSS
jgi:DNA modification methylase